MNPTPQGAVRRRLAAILSSDAVRYSSLMAEDDVGTLRALEGHLDVMAAGVSRHGGRVVDSVGDNLLAELPSVMDAVLCAQEVQDVLRERNEPLPARKRLEFRIGIHLGDLLVEGERIAGDGVNIAARIEGMAEPGGLALSGAAFEHVEGKIELAIEDLGECTLKNIPKRVRVLRTAAGAVAAGPLSDPTSVPGFAGRPAIAVLPFENLSGDPSQEYFADGLTEELITRLAECGLLPVIARNSTFVFKGKSVDVKTVSRELGARYVVEGSVRLSGTHLRVTSQLIDATTGHHLWAERYDRKLDDVFVLQDEITEAIVASMHPGLLSSEQRRARAAPSDLNSWDAWLRGIFFFHRQSRSNNKKARSLFLKATRLDRTTPSNWSWLAMTYWVDLALQWSDAPERSLRHLVETSQRAATLNPNDSHVLLAVACAAAASGRQEEALAACEAAIAANPSSAYCYSHTAGLLSTGGRPEVAIALGEKALRLSPRDPESYLTLMFIAMSYFALRRYEEARSWAERSRRQNAAFPGSVRLLAASNAHLGRIDAARAAWEEAHRLAPQFTPAGLRAVHGHADPDVIERFIEGLRKAGMEA